MGGRDSRRGRRRARPIGMPYARWCNAAATGCPSLPTEIFAVSTMSSTPSLTPEQTGSCRPNRYSNILLSILAPGLGRRTSNARDPGDCKSHESNWSCAKIFLRKRAAEARSCRDKMHLEVFCHVDWKNHPVLRDSLFPVFRHDFERLAQSHASESELDYFHYILDQVSAVQGSKHVVEDERLSWYMRHQTNEYM